jgi:hypothetical protein
MDALADVMKNTKYWKEIEIQNCMLLNHLKVVRFFKIIFKKQIKNIYIYLDQKLNKTKTNIMAKSRR